MKIVVIQGPNLNMLGIREQHVYGPMKLEQIHAQMKEFATQNNIEIEFFQSNLEGEIVDKLQECYGDAQGIILNAAAYTHTSIAIRDAISAISIPTIEVHISNIHRREEFRKTNMIAPVCTSSIVGFGPFGYHLAMMGMLQIMQEIQAVQASQEAQQQAPQA
ncbi:MAG: type II 3-dehydroquinate dehydratase [Epsilonproteobacteria bacterium]|nr:type II 3-dehydroquinate dehydratase [Campylobacterota bacterium]OIO13434.1 MAG: type II 3-dehydroquinate dehydratase [Helicobacteraceae bacterium CG1_02_36_14]PIP09889.1 MAG: type II 3-dehydroquinate dehydratase [Sulfurimonas sp. CG23_combo_of_CG06-09_8_20_14_all_36_33]PIS24105.1 MAG: type II 3-dehydroquinate dehydratase [Sulfurimonas sp. CG08_land_8_20_14_0_20_36_33]PIU35589.1 MAG: type II 3-dehydroquinate dehydratase [Sulfurimonas sp. CG07_land_8_20_14_0_80_36_56]PIV05510.1 MAG: type II 